MAAPAPPRQIAIAKSTPASRQSGVLPIPAAAIANRNVNNPAQKDRDAKLKVVVRRLAPGLTEEEFRLALGDEWKVGGGKIDWTSYQIGKIAKDTAKPSRPSRAYLHLTHAQYLGPLADKIRTTQFADAKGSLNDSALLGPPVLVFTPFGKIPAKPRGDNRQGTIDQDPEFIDFLTSLTAPVPRATNIDAITATKEANDKKLVTPLVQYIKDKKANKGKDGKGKHGRQESKDNPAKTEDKKNAAKGGKGKTAAVEKKAVTQVKEEKIRKEDGSKAAKTSAPAQRAASPASPVVKPAAPASNAAQPKPERRRERGNASMAAKILQRDLGLAGGQPSRRRRDAAAATPANNNLSQESAAVPVATPSAQPVTALITSTAQSADPNANSTPTGPAASRKPQTNTQPVAQQIPTASKSKPSPAPNSTQAFLKHANPSQGVTEPLLEEAFRAFGVVTKVEIDKKKGFAYVDFVDASSLQKAIASSPVKVAQGSVVVLERKSGPTLQTRNVRGQAGPASQTPAPNRSGRSGGRGRGGRAPANGNKSLDSASASNSSPAPVTAPS